MLSCYRSLLLSILLVLFNTSYVSGTDTITTTKMTTRSILLLSLVTASTAFSYNTNSDSNIRRNSFLQGHDDNNNNNNRKRQRQTQYHYDCHIMTYTTRCYNSHSYDNDTNNYLNKDKLFLGTSQQQREFFSVAPMMGHTNRHYRFFFSLLSQHTFLYTEMIPAQQIVRAFNFAKSIYLNKNQDPTMNTNTSADPEEILEVMYQISKNPSKQFAATMMYSHMNIPILDELIGILSSSTTFHGEQHIHKNPISLQLGGDDPTKLATASAIAMAYNSNNNENGNYYDSVNLNCGCPSNAVGGRNCGVVLMKDPSHVAKCVEAMNDSAQGLLQHQKQHTNVVLPNSRSGESLITVKHRIGVQDATTYDSILDKKKDDTEAYETCKTFVKAITLSGAVTKCHVHVRLGLIGDFSSPASTENDGNDNDDMQQKLWTPSSVEKEPRHEKNTNSNNSTTTSSEIVTTTRETMTNNNISKPKHEKKINHKRVQERAKKLAREATINNRNIPPLRPTVVYKLSNEFPNIEFVMNGGIQTLKDVKKHLSHNNNVDSRSTTSSPIIGTMVGRAVINHPCSFAAADTLWEENSRANRSARPTRGEILLEYIKYCDEEEERIYNHLLSCSGDELQQEEKQQKVNQYMNILTRKLVAVPYHLFIGELGNDKYQRCIKKITNRNSCSTPDFKIKASSILQGAMSFLPIETLDKCVDDYIALENIPVYKTGKRRSSSMQRIIY